jgi:putative glutamine amidotransferase
VTTYLERAQSGVWDVPASFLPHSYIESVTRAGGTVVLLPPQPVDETTAARVVAGLDGLVLTGGKDVDPARYGRAPHPITDTPRPDRDAWEFALLERAVSVDLPVLGICRGAQVLNVLRGGTLHQHLPDVVGHERYQLGDGVYSTAPVDVDPGTTLASLVGRRVEAKLYHHQAVETPGLGVVVSARTTDGVVEAVELPDRRFVVAVQWHPEEDDDSRIFDGLVAAAALHAAERAATRAAAGNAAPASADEADPARVDVGRPLTTEGTAS